MREPWRASSYRALNVVHSKGKGLHACTHPNWDKHCAEAQMKEKTYTLELHVPVLGSGIVLSSHLATLNTNTPHSVTADYSGPKKSLQPTAGQPSPGMRNKQQSNMLPILRSPHTSTVALCCKSFKTTRMISSPSIDQHITKAAHVKQGNLPRQ